jgi:hypothetical protein
MQNKTENSKEKEDFNVRIQILSKYWEFEVMLRHLLVAVKWA